MMITREQIEARLAQLRVDKTQLVANIHAINGAIQDCEYWIAQLTEGQPSPASEEPEGANIGGPNGIRV